MSHHECIDRMLFAADFCSRKTFNMSNCGIRFSRDFTTATAQNETSHEDIDLTMVAAAPVISSDHVLK